MNNKFKYFKKEIRDGLIVYMKKKEPGRSLSTYKTYVSDSNYLLNNSHEDEFVRFVRSNDKMPEIRDLIKKTLIEHRGEEKVTEKGVNYYYEKLCLQREYIHSIGGIDTLLKHI